MKDFQVCTKYMNELFNQFFPNMGINKVTKYVSDKFTVKVTRIGKVDKRDTRIEFKVTVGEPNYAERIFIKECKKAGEPFPVREPQLKFYPKKRK